MSEIPQNHPPEWQEDLAKIPGYLKGARLVILRQGDKRNSPILQIESSNDHLIARLEDLITNMVKKIDFKDIYESRRQLESAITLIILTELNQDTSKNVDIYNVKEAIHNGIIMELENEKNMPMEGDHGEKAVGTAQSATQKNIKDSLD